MSGMRIHTVERGETLATIAKVYYGDANLLGLIFQANKKQVDNPNQIHLNQRLMIPYAPHELGLPIEVDDGD